MMIDTPITKDGLDKWLVSEWKTYANRISPSCAIYLDVKVGEGQFRVGRTSPSLQQTLLYEGTDADEAIKVWNEHRHEARK